MRLLSLALLLMTPLFAVVYSEKVGREQSIKLAEPLDAVVAIGYRGASGQHISKASGVLIDPQTILTASHIIKEDGIADTVYFGADINNPLTTRKIASYINDFWSKATLEDGAPDYGDGSDLALIRLDRPVLDIEPYPVCGYISSLLGREITLTGYGRSGLGSRGLYPKKPSARRLAGTNTFDHYAKEAEGPRILADFDDGTPESNSLTKGSERPTTYEAITAAGDSGGPALIQIDNKWVIIGVLNAGVTPDGAIDSGYGEIAYWTGLASALPWLEHYTDCTIYSLDTAE